MKQSLLTEEEELAAVDPAMDPAVDPAAAVYDMKTEWVKAERRSVIFPLFKNTFRTHVRYIAFFRS